jgi:hypothetical protein
VINFKNTIKNKLKSSLQNFNSWKTNRKIIVIESDDWGSIRMPNKEVFTKAESFGVKVSKCPYNSYDTLANSSDLEKLFEVLLQFKDKNNNYPIITANTIVANPDFDKIRNDNFLNYYYEPFTETLKKYYPNENVFSFWEFGIRNKVFKPQLHGREHLYVDLWMNFLRSNSKETRFAFDNKFFGISTTITSEKRTSFLPAFDFYQIAEIENQKSIITDAQKIFNDIFLYPSKSFIAPNYTWSHKIEPILKDCGISVIQGGKIQKEPIEGQNFRRVMHFMGDKNENGQVYLVRNIQFEPSINKNIEWTKSVISQIENAFFWKTPAIISSHRLNYIGGLNQENSDDNLKMLFEILLQITKKWPDVEFMSSDQLGELILEN